MFGFKFDIFKKYKTFINKMDLTMDYDNSNAYYLLLDLHSTNNNFIVELQNDLDELEIYRNLPQHLQEQIQPYLDAQKIMKKLGD